MKTPFVRALSHRGGDRGVWGGGCQGKVAATNWSNFYGKTRKTKISLARPEKKIKIQLKEKTVVSKKSVEIPDKGDTPEKKRLYVGIFPILGGGLTQTHFFCLFAKFFFACQNHPEVLKHVLFF